jgi:putative transposase
LPLIRASYAASGGVYGYRRVKLDLRETGEICGRHRGARLMKANKIRAVHGYKVARGHLRQAVDRNAEPATTGVHGGKA